MANVNLDFEDYFKERCPQHEFLVERMREAFEVKKVSYADIHSLNLIKFRNYMLENVSNNSLITYFAVTKACLKDMFADGLISNIRCLSELNVKRTPSENVYCTEEEIARMDAYFDELIKKHGRQTEKDCLCLFLLENVTGARASDCINLSLANIRDGKLTYISKKTKQKSVMPVHHKLMKYLKYMPKKDYSRMQKNRVIKKVAKECGITQEIRLFYRGQWRNWPKYKYLSTHDGRRSFASILDRKGAPISEICQFMNHGHNLTMTARYIIPDYNHVSEEALSFFNG